LVKDDAKRKLKITFSSGGSTAQDGEVVAVRGRKPKSNKNRPLDELCLEQRLLFVDIENAQQMVAQRKLSIDYKDSSKFSAKLVVDSNWPFTGCQGVKDARVIAGTVTCSFEPRVQDVSDGKRFIYYKLADAELHKKLSKSVLAAAHIDLAVLNDQAEVYFTNPQSVSLLAWLSSSPTCLEFKLKAFAADVHHGLDFFDRSASPLSVTCPSSSPDRLLTSISFL